MKNIKFIGYQDAEKNPAGGVATGPGVHVIFQNGPIHDNIPNGASVEDIIELAKARLEFFQESKFKTYENALAISHLQLALDALEARTKARTARGVEGTHQV